MDIKHITKNGQRHVFHFLADGNRPVLEIYVDESTDTDAKLPILINGVGKGPDDIQQTKGTTHADVSGDKTRICMNCLAKYIVPRIATLMARVYVPAVIPPLSEDMLNDLKI